MLPLILPNFQIYRTIFCGSKEVRCKLVHTTSQVNYTGPSKTAKMLVCMITDCVSEFCFCRGTIFKLTKRNGLSVCVCGDDSWATTSRLNICFNFEGVSTESSCSKCSFEGALLLPAFVQSVWFEGYFHQLPLLCSRSVSVSRYVIPLSHSLTHSLLWVSELLLLITTLK